MYINYLSSHMTVSLNKQPILPENWV